MVYILGNAHILNTGTVNKEIVVFFLLFRQIRFGCNHKLKWFEIIYLKKKKRIFYIEGKTFCKEMTK